MIRVRQSADNEHDSKDFCTAARISKLKRVRMKIEEKTYGDVIGLSLKGNLTSEPETIRFRTLSMTSSKIKYAWSES